jgi:hypothetical protein
VQTLAYGSNQSPVAPVSPASPHVAPIAPARPTLASTPPLDFGSSPAPVAPVIPTQARHSVPAAHLPADFAGKLGHLGLSSAQLEAVLSLSREVVEQVVWEVVPVLAETIIKEEIKRLLQA